MSDNTEFNTTWRYAWSVDACHRRIDHFTATYAPLEESVSRYLHRMHERISAMPVSVERYFLNDVLAFLSDSLENLRWERNPFTAWAHKTPATEVDFDEYVLSMPEAEMRRRLEELNAAIAVLVPQMQSLERMMDLFGDTWPDDAIVHMCKAFGLQREHFRIRHNASDADDIRQTRLITRIIRS